LKEINTIEKETLKNVSLYQTFELQSLFFKGTTGCPADHGKKLGIN